MKKIKILYIIVIEFLLYKFIIFFSLVFSPVYLSEIKLTENITLKITEDIKDEYLYELIFTDKKNSNLAVEKILKKENYWIGKIYKFEDIFYKNLMFKFNFDFDYNEESFEYKEYKKNEGFFYISDDKEYFGVKELELKELTREDLFKFKNPKFYMKKMGKSPVLTSKFEQYIGDKYSILDDKNILMGENIDLKKEIIEVDLLKNMLSIFLLLNAIFLLYFYLKREKDQERIGNYIAEKTFIRNIIIIFIFLLKDIVFNSLKIYSFPFQEILIYFIVTNFILGKRLGKNKEEKQSFQTKILENMQYLFIPIFFTIVLKFLIHLDIESKSNIKELFFIVDLINLLIYILFFYSISYIHYRTWKYNDKISALNFTSRFMIYQSIVIILLVYFCYML